MKRSGRKEPSNRRSELYDDGQGNRLFVPLRWMLLLHKASSERPAATKAELIDRAKRRNETLATLTVSRVDAALRKHRNVPWFDSWLLAGEAAPEDVTLLTERQLDAVDEATDYGRILRELPSIRRPNRRRATRANRTYDLWFRQGGLIPATSFTDWCRWMLWLYSGISPGWFIIDEKLEALRVALTHNGRCAGAAISRTTPSRWQKIEADRQALECAIDWAKAGRQSNLEDDPRWRLLFVDPPYYLNSSSAPRARIRRAAQEKKRASMLAYAETFNWQDTLAGVGLLRQDFDAKRRNARSITGEKAGEDELLMKFVRSEAPAAPHHNTRGMIDAEGTRKIFWPPLVMREFQRQATSTWARSGMSALRRLPCFELLLLDRVLPRNVGRPCDARTIMTEIWRRTFQPTSSPSDGKLTVTADSIAESVANKLRRKNTGGRPEKYAGLVRWVNDRTSPGQRINWTMLLKEWNEDHLDCGKFTSAKHMAAVYYRTIGGKGTTKPVS